MPAYPDLSPRPINWGGLQDAIGGLGDTLKQNRLLENRTTYGQQFAADPQGAINNALANGDSDYASKLSAEKSRQDELGIQKENLLTNKGHLAVSQGQLGVQQQQLGIQQRKADEDLQTAQAGRMAGVAQRILGSQDPNEQQAWASNLYNNPANKKHFDNYGITDADPKKLAQFLIDEHRGYVEPKFQQIGENYIGQKQFGWVNPQAAAAQPQQAVTPFGSISAEGAVPAEVESKAQDIANYRAAPYTGMAATKPYATAVSNRVDAIAQGKGEPYDATRWATALDTEKKLAGGDVAKSLRSIGRLFDETEQASALADASNNSGFENINRLSGAVYPSSSQYQQGQGKLGTALNNVVDTASAVAKGGGQGAEGDAKRRSETMNRYQAPDTLKGALQTEAEIGLKNGQSNLSSYNTAHGYTPDHPKYKTIMDYMTPAQQEKAIAMLGASKIEEITGKPIAKGGPAQNVPQQQNAQPSPFPDHPDAQKAPDGNWYVPDPQRQGKYLRIGQ